MLLKAYETVPTSPLEPYNGRSLLPNLSTCGVPKETDHKCEYPTTSSAKNILNMKSRERKNVPHFSYLSEEKAAEALTLTTGNTIPIDPELIETRCKEEEYLNDFHLSLILMG